MMNENQLHRACYLSSRQIIYLALVFLLALLALLPSKAVAANNNDETVVIDGISYYVLRNAEDWQRLNQIVVEGEGKSDINAIMDADFTVNTMIGSQTYPYRGIFDGNGHTLNVEIDNGTEDFGAPFLVVANSTFRNLHVTGTVKGGKHCSGLVSTVTNKPNVYFESVWVSVSVSTNSRYLAGFFGHCVNADVFVTDCRFDGKLTSSNKDNTTAGAFIGWGGEGGWTFHRAYEDGTYSVKGSSGGFCRDSNGNRWWGYNSKSTLCLSSHDWGEMKDSNHKKVKDQSTVVTRMNEEKAGSWQLVGGKAVPVMKKNGLDATFETYDPVPGTEEGELNLLKIPFSCDQMVKWVEATYTNESGNYVDLGRTEMPKNTYAGFIKVPATEAHRNMKIRAKLLVGEVNITYNAKSDAVMHNPRKLSAELLRFAKDTLSAAGTLQLKWRTHDAKYNDVVDGDQFAVLRSLTGKMEDMQQIGSVVMDSSDSIYTYNDETLISNLTQELLSEGRPKVKYIVVRASAQQLWGLNNNVASATVEPMLDNLHLLRIKDYTAKWDDQTAHTVKVAWQYGDEYGAAWDSRAQLKMQVTSTNRVGAPVDSTVYVLTNDEMAACSKVITLHRSCVNYKIDIYVEPGTSPLPTEADKFMEIRTEEDWNTFVQKVGKAGGKEALKAMLLADITVEQMVGQTEEAPFRGVFEGNGYTLTFNQSDGREQFIAPFRYVKGATIRNLHTKGSITSNQKHIAGIVGHAEISSDVLIEGCRSSMEIWSNINGDATNGGIVATSRANLTIRNTVFDGSFKGANCDMNGGFIGWLNNNATLENCLFAPSLISTKTDASATWARNNSYLTLINCHNTKEYNSFSNYFVIGSAADWDTFCQKVADAKGASRIDAVLAADITITKPVGDRYSSPYSGFFEGNGHTLNVNISSGDGAAPFRNAKDYIIQNLRVTGSVNGGRYASGLVGYIYGSNNTITNCRVSAKVTTTGDRVAGFVGYNSGTPHNIRNSLFDGKLVASGANCRGAAFVGYTAYSVTNIGNCLENGTYENFSDLSDIGFCRDSSNPFGYDDNNNWSYHNWANDVGSMTSEELAARLGSSHWTVTDGMAMPVMSPVPIGTVAGKSADDIIALLGPGYWTKDNKDKVVPITINKVQAKPASTYLDSYRIFNANDWDTFRTKVENAKGKYDVNAVLMADITITEPAGIGDEFYRGVFDGNGHTIIANINRNLESTAIIQNVNDTAIIRNLNVKGSIMGARHSSGLVGRVGNMGVLVVENCHVSATITTSSNYAGGIIGHGHSGNITVRNCLFDGTIINNASGTSYAGAFIGWSDEATRVTENCVENGTYENFPNSGANYYYKGSAHLWGGTNNWTYKTSGWDELNHIGTLTAQELVEKVGSNNWRATDSIHVLPLVVNNMPIPDMESFYYENLGKIDKNSLVAQTQQCSVVLTWANQDEEPVDYYEVWRSDVQTPDDFIRIATQLRETQYEDKTTSPVHQYKYKVRGVNDCEGKSYTDTKTVDGQCVQTANISGFFRFADGTGIPGTEIIATHANGTTKTVKTDESGYFIICDLPYVNKTETSYKIAPNLNGFSDDKTIVLGTEPGNNMVRNVEFVMTKSVKLSGYVQYNGTSIPVQGVSFMVDGYEVHNAAGKVVTDHEGKFVFHMLEGPHDSIQAVKDGHVFYRGGYYHESDSDPDSKKDYSFTADKAGIYFYDDTRVKLIGRVAGGKDQGEIPLGNSLSKNNLGDDLQMVFVLEGDNASRLVWDIQDKNKKERDEVFKHNAHDKKYDYQTKVHTTINRMVVTPDVHTGEYEVLLPPVKWKIQQITAKGYATLFQDGQVGDVIDLSDSLTAHSDTIQGSWKNAEKVDVTTAIVNYHAQYKRIYHSPVLIDYKQQGFDPFDYFGDHYYNFKNLAGDKQKLALAYGVRKKNWPAGKRDSLETKYTFGYPVFSIDRKYAIDIAATEKYYYNNNTKSDTIDIIHLSGGVVTIHNGMVSSTHKDTLQLDSLGMGTYLLEAAQVPYLLTGKDALRTVSMTLEMDGTHYEAKPLHAYILNIQQLQGAKDILTYSTPQLVDILRDPPGGTSKATLSKGSTLKYSYQMDMKWSAGVSFTISAGSGLNSFTGVVAAPMGAGGVGGFNVIASNSLSTSIDLVWSGSGNRAFNYTMTTTEDISTSSEKGMVGADADLYMGVVQNIVVKPATAIRAIPDSVYQQIGGQLKSGRTIEIAQGLDDQGKLLHLVRDEVVTFGPVIKSNFVHSQHYIVNQLIPELLQECRSLLFTGQKEQAQERADLTNEIVYWSKVAPDHPDFGLEYEVIQPKGMTATTKVNEVARYHQNMVAWMEMIARNEEEKITANELVQNFDVDGGGSISYSESFSSDYSNTSSFVSPITPMTADYFDSTAGDTALGIVAVLGPTVAKILSSVLKTSAGGTQGATGSGRDENGKMMVEVEAIGVTFKFGLVPSMSFNVTPKHSESKAYSRKESFSIGMDKRSHLNIDVYRVKTASEGLSGYGVQDVFVSNNFYEQTKYNYEYLKREMDLKNYTNTTSFVYRTRSGATCRPWEGERKTLFYNPGTTLDERTKKIENPVIKMDKQSISGVPFGEPARFKLYLTNESEQPEAVYPYFDLYQVDKANPKGAKMIIDGVPLTGNARTIEVSPGQITEKTLEVYASEAFDYEGLKIGIISQGDVKIFQEVAFDVHYLQTAGAISITTPGDKWIMNCDAPQDGEKGWYLPVIISGFDKNQHNFDHIEFQYKESARGDDHWTNLCGYYADSTIYVSASGTKEMIPENGNITTRFFGEGTVMEKAYDLRAVLFCRNGNSFLTNSSPVLSGVKDTRRPQLFGTPEPKDAVLNAGENIIFNFSEDIEYNYLQETTNFEVKGETNEGSIQEAPALMFGGKGYVQSEARRNFSDKSVTVEVMIKPDDVDEEMPIFSHGSDGNCLQLWLTKARTLKAVVDDNILESDVVINSTGFQRVAMVLDNERKTLYLYSTNLDDSLNNVTYSGYGPLTFGAADQISDNPTESGERIYYKGRMLQARIWNRALDLVTLNSYGNQLLTGYEKGLMDYYPMNEGKGLFATDQAQGAHLMLIGATWSQPHGMSLKLDKNLPQDPEKIKGIQIKSDFMSRNNEKDYTLMFWFKTNEENGTLLSNGSGYKADVNAEEKFFIGIEDHTLKYRTNGHEYELGDKTCDDAWHHFAMTVNRVRQVASIYVDNNLKAQFSTDSLGGMTGNRFYLGNMVWQEEGLNNDKVNQANALTGYIDGLALFGQALPLTLIERYTSKAPGGKEKGLITYVDFERQERQKSGELVMEPYVLSKVVKYDEKGNESEKRDTIFVDPVDDIMAKVDQNIGAPMQAYEELRNLNFSFVGRDNQLLVNVDEMDKRINKRNIYVTIADIPDKNGNFMASPKTESFFVNRNPLTWFAKRLTRTLPAGVEHQFPLVILNQGGAAHTYSIENLPRWMTVNKTSDIVDAQATDEVTVTISKDVNVGNYDHIVYLTDENGLSEPLPLEITIEGEAPEWEVKKELMRYSMNVVGQVYVGGSIVTDSRDIVGVFDAKGRCMGSNHVKYDAATGRSMVYLTVYDSTTVDSPLFFRLWHHRTGKTMQLTTSQTINFGDQSIVGSVDKPIHMHADDLYLQRIELEEGWNWVSFNVYNSALRRVSTVLNMFSWKEGDILTEDSEDLTLVYKNGKWMSNTSMDISKVTVSQEYCYRVKVQDNHTIDFWGTSLRDPDLRTINVKKGWNSIGYTPMVNLPISTALTEYFDEATPGDVLKNQHEFAMFASDGAGGGEWLGTLEYMKPGEGYMLYRQKDGEGSFRYPYYEPGTTFIDISSSRAARFATTMNVIATVENVELEEGDRLVVYAKGEVVGSGQMMMDNRQLFFLSIEGENETPLTFAIERGDDIIATTGEVMTYKPDAIYGTPSEPTKIDFVLADQLPQEGWYTLQGVKLQKAPTQSGVYIYNGHKQIVK